MDQYLGEIRMFGGSFAPEGWVLCNGQQLPIKGHEALFNLLGTTYGGDGVTAFAVPDLHGRIEQLMPDTCIHFIMSTRGLYPTHSEQATSRTLPACAMAPSHW